MAKFTLRQLKKARHTNMYEFMLAQGESFQKMGQREYAHTEHDSMRANPKTGVVTWYAHNQLSSYDNAIDFAVEYFQKPYEETVNQLLSFKGTGISKSIQQKSAHEKKPPFSLKILSKGGNFDTNTLSDKGRSFLVNERFLDPKYVDNLAKAGLISSDNKENILFKWTDPNNVANIVGADVQGTYRQPIEKRLNQATGKLGRPYYKGIAANSSSTGGFRVPVFQDLTQPLRLYVTESPIEALSLIEHNLKTNDPEKAIYFSQSGLKYDAMKEQIESLTPFVKDNEQLEVVFAVNNDEHGREYVKDSLKKLKAEDFEVHPFLQMPNINNGDWNEALELEKTGQLKSRLTKEKDLNQAQVLLQNKKVVEDKKSINPLNHLIPGANNTVKKETSQQLEVTR